MEPDVWISKSYKNTDFKLPLTLDNKVTIFYDRVTGWQIDIAKQLNENVQHCGYGVLSILFSYFEMIAQHEKGTSSDGGSASYFAAGFRSVFPTTTFDDHYLEKVIYRWVRCGLYHDGFSRCGVQVSGHYDRALAENSSVLKVNPALLLAAIQRHFDEYKAILDDPANTSKRQKFEEFFDRGEMPAAPSVPGRSSGETPTPFGQSGASGAVSTPHPSAVGKPYKEG